MLNLEASINEDVACKCCTKHVPLPNAYYQIDINGRPVWLCPTTYHNYKSLLMVYIAQGSPADGSTRKHYSKYTQQLVEETWNARR